MEIQLKIDERKAQDLLNRLRDRATDLTPAMQAIGAFYERSVQENFKAQSGPDGTPLAAALPHHPDDGPGPKKGLKKSGGLSARGNAT